MDIVASAPSRTTAARALVDCANRSWRLKYPTSKTDDCAVVCLFLQQELTKHDATFGSISSRTHEAAENLIHQTDNPRDSVINNATEIPNPPMNSEEIIHEIVPIPESSNEKPSDIQRSNTTRSLAECISVAEDDNWSALEGVTRVNSLLSIPRLFSGDKKSTSSRRKWL